MMLPMTATIANYSDRVASIDLLSIFDAVSVEQLQQIQPGESLEFQCSGYDYDIQLRYKAWCAQNNFSPTAADGVNLDLQ